MQSILKAISNIFDFNEMFLFIVAAVFLLFADAPSFKKQNLQKEYKLAKIIGYVYIVVGIGIYVVARYIRV